MLGLSRNTIGCVNFQCLYCYLLYILGPVYVITEFAPHGNLKDFLKSRRPVEHGCISDIEGVGTLTEKDLLSYAYQVSRGMQYLASRKVGQL